MKTNIPLVLMMIIATVILLLISRNNYLASRMPSSVNNSQDKSVRNQPLVAPAVGPLFANPDNPRYFTDGTKVNGKYKVVYITGAHTWCTLSDCDDQIPIVAIFDYNKYLDFVQDRGYNFIKLWRVENVGGGENGPDFWYSPMPYERSNTECCAYDGGNKFDLTRFNQAYFDRLRERVILARDRGMYVTIMLFDGWSVESKYDRHVPWIGHPYNLVNNANNVDGDIDDNGQGEETHILVGTEITALQEAYVRKVIDTVNNLDNVLYEISNESPGDNPDTPAFDGSRDWQYHMIRFVKDYESGKPKQHPVGMTWEWLYGNNQYYYDSPADWISLGGNLNLDVYSPPATDGSPNSKIILADTDHLCGICGSQQWVWKSFTRGENPIFSDIYDPATSGRGLPYFNAKEEEIRRNLTYTMTFAKRMNLVQMAPQPALCSTAFCLASTASSPAEFLVYLPGGGNATVNLSAAIGQLNYEWFSPANATTQPGGTIMGGASRSFTPPFPGDAVLYIYAAVSNTITPTNSAIPPSVTFTRTNAPTIQTATRTSTPLNPAATKTNTPLSQPQTATPTFSFSTLTATSVLSFPTLTFTIPAPSSTPSSATIESPTTTGTIPVTTIEPTITSTPIPSEPDPSRIFLYCLFGVLVTVAVVGVIIYLFWVFRELSRSR
jgi:hypothetical protein